MRNRIFFTVRFGAVIYPTVWFGTVLKNKKSYGAVRCGFHRSEVLRCGSARFPLNVFSYGAVPLHVRRKKRVTPLFLYAAPYERTAVSYCSHAFSRRTKETVVSLRCTVLLINRTQPRFHTVLPLFLGAAFSLRALYVFLRGTVWCFTSYEKSTATAITRITKQIR